jgi:hypothetical protein
MMGVNQGRRVEVSFLGFHGIAGFVDRGGLAGLSVARR